MRVRPYLAWRLAVITRGIQNPRLARLFASAVTGLPGYDGLAVVGLLHGVTDFPGAFCYEPGSAFATCQPPHRFYIFLNGDDLDRRADEVVRGVILHELGHVILEHRADATGKAYSRQEAAACRKAKTWGAVIQRASEVTFLPARQADAVNELTHALCLDLEAICNSPI